MNFAHATSPEPETLRRFRRGGFTLAEVLAAMLFMAVVIPVALEGLSIASRAGEVAVRKGEAALVAERVLNECLVATNWNQAVQSGTVRQGIRDFRWTLRNEPWNEDFTRPEMRLLSVEVIFTAQGRDCVARLSTLVDSSAALSQTNTYQYP
jgi:type II secretory pathway pseudopilin PulG